MAPWLQEVAELVHAGRRKEAVELTRTRASAGDIAGKVRLAIFGEEAGLSRDEADAVVDQAASQVPPEDSDAHWVLHSAYELRLGTCEYDEKARRALRHLQACAELSSNPIATYAVAVRYGQGDIGTKPDLQLADAWMERAANLGNPLAIRSVARGRRDA